MPSTYMECRSSASRSLAGEAVLVTSVCTPGSAEGGGVRDEIERIGDRRVIGSKRARAADCVGVDDEAEIVLRGSSAVAGGA